MIASITIWVKGIIFVVLFASFLELLLPSNGMQRFVRVIMGLFILLAILNPIIGVLESQLAADQLPAIAMQTGGSLDDTGILNAANSVSGKRDQLARDMYIRDLSKQIRATIMALDGVADAKVTVEVESSSAQGSKGIGKIKNVVVFIKPGITADERKVAKVTIGSTQPELEESKRLPAAVADKAKRAVTELYQLRASQVEVKQMN